MTRALEIRKCEAPARIGHTFSYRDPLRARKAFRRLDGIAVTGNSRELQRNSSSLFDSDLSDAQRWSRDGKRNRDRSRRCPSESVHDHIIESVAYGGFC